MIGEYERDEVYRSRLGTHPKIWTPTEAQVTLMRYIRSSIHRLFFVVQWIMG